MPSSALSDTKIKEEKAQTSMLNRINDFDIKFLLKTKERSITKAELDTNNKRKGSFREGFSQEIVPVKQFIGGMIQTTDNHFVKVLEVLPLNYYQKNKKEQNRVIMGYEPFFRICPSSIQVIKTAESTNMIKLLDNLRIQYNKERNEKLKACITRFITYIENLAKEKSFTEKSYVVFRYEGNSNDINEIYRDVNATATELAMRYSEIGNICLTHINDNDFNIDLLYRFLNRKSMYKETSDFRRLRIVSDTSLYNQELKENEKRGLDQRSFVAPRGYDNTYHDAILMDGTYFTFLALQSDGYPEAVYGGWLDKLRFGNGTDLTVFFKKVNREATISRLKTTTRLSRVSANSQITKNPEKYNEIMHSLNNRNHLLNCLQSGDDMFYVNIIITIRGDSLDDVRQRRNSIKKSLESQSLFLEESFHDAEDYFKSTMPLANLDRSIYMRTRQNMTTRSCASTYNFTSYELFDESGIVLGKNLENGSIVALNNYNTQRYTNANILMLGTSGAGKTFTEQCMGTRQTMIGIRTFYLLPVKGHEYYNGITQMGGTFAQLHPGNKNCINFLEIRPEVSIDADLVEDMPDIQQSLLSKKVNSISVFLTLLLKENEDITTTEMNYLNECLYSMYHDYGITDDNNSIFKDAQHHILKKMPHFSDMYDRMKQMPQLKRLTPLLIPFVNGSFKNFDGDTNIDLSRSAIAFDVNKDIVGKQFLAAIMYIAFDLIYDMTKSTRLCFDSIYLDEVWIMMKNKACAEQVQNLLKLIRGYGGAAIVTTQDIFDFLNNEFGPAVIGNTDIKMLLKMKDSEAERVANYINLTDDEVKRIQRFQRGDCMLISNGDKIKLHIEASEYEIETFTTDPNILRKIALRKKEETEMQKKSQKKKRVVISR